LLLIWRIRVIATGPRPLRGDGRWIVFGLLFQTFVNIGMTIGTA
jgi:cell division protein FtsW (lipid II flippase)